jgi:hypothetical protein
MWERTSNHYLNKINNVRVTRRCGAYVKEKIVTMETEQYVSSSLLLNYALDNFTNKFG